MKKGTFESKDRLITVRPSFFEKVHVAVPEGVNGYALAKNRLLFLVDLPHLIAISHGTVQITSKEAQDMITKLDLLSRNKWWRALAGHGMDLIETLITMGAGYGFLRLVEIFLTHAFGH
jgi:hypothetical protein